MIITLFFVCLFVWLAGWVADWLAGWLNCPPDFRPAYQSPFCQPPPPLFLCILSPSSSLWQESFVWTLTPSTSASWLQTKILCLVSEHFQKLWTAWNMILKKPGPSGENLKLRRLTEGGNDIHSISVLLYIHFIIVLKHRVQMYFFVGNALC